MFLTQAIRILIACGPRYCTHLLEIRFSISWFLLFHFLFAEDTRMAMGRFARN